MLTAELDYDLPPELIAQRPAIPRDSSRLLIYERSRRNVIHSHLAGLPERLNAGDVLVFNDSRVLPARLPAVRETGGKAELLFLRQRAARLWEALVKPTARLRKGSRLYPAAPDSRHHELMLRRNLGEGLWLVENNSGMELPRLLEKAGEVPLPPYIKERLEEPESYQTVYAREPGSAAAPTAGLHFTPDLIGRLQALGVTMAPVTLHIGLDTFRPIGEADLALHRIHTERYRMPPETLQAIEAARARGGKVVAVGTTSVRVLETVFAPGGPPAPDSPRLAGETGLFITPGYRFNAVDALLTNFHLPRSTLLALVMAFAGVPEIRSLYREAVCERYRFYSFGDAMLIE